jgi:hypothetical protein
VRVSKGSVSLSPRSLLLNSDRDRTTFAQRGAQIVLRSEMAYPERTAVLT